MRLWQPTPRHPAWDSLTAPRPLLGMEFSAADRGAALAVSTDGSNCVLVANRRRHGARLPKYERYDSADKSEPRHLPSSV